MVQAFNHPGIDSPGLTLWKIKRFDVFWRSSPCLAVEASRRVVLSRPGLGVLGRDVLNKIARVQRDAGHDGARLYGVLHGRDLKRIKGVAHNSLETTNNGPCGCDARNNCCSFDHSGSVVDFTQQDKFPLGRGWLDQTMAEVSQDH